MSKHWERIASRQEDVRDFLQPAAEMELTDGAVGPDERRYLPLRYQYQVIGTRRSPRCSNFPAVRTTRGFVDGMGYRRGKSDTPLHGHACWDLSTLIRALFFKTYLVKMQKKNAKRLESSFMGARARCLPK